MTCRILIAIKFANIPMPISRFYKFINNTINKHALLRCVSNRKQKLLAKPWLTVGLRKSIRVKNALFHTSACDKYKFYRNKIISLTRLSKANYYQSFFDLNIRNVLQTWKGINKLIGSCKKKNKRNPINLICSDFFRFKFFYCYALFKTLIALTILQKLHHLKREKKYNNTSPK